MFESMRPATAAAEAVGAPRLEGMLLARHLLIDQLLDAAIQSGEISQVIEIAAGLSPRGWRFTRRHGDRLTYMETDLPEMVERKQRALEEAGALGPEHRVVALDALAEDGGRSLGSVAAELDPDRGTAIITEGLLSYLDRASVLALWRREAETLSPFPHGLMLSDLHLASDSTGLVVTTFTRLLSLFVRGRVLIHFDHESEAIEALVAAGFADASLHRGTEISDAPGAGAVRVIEARRVRASA
jgi:O-methyltransferase involved in polyketide biosynthesis